GEAGYPIQPKEHGVGFLQEQRHLWLRSSRQRLILAVRHSIIKAIRDYFDSRGFTLVDAPILTPAACEGTSTLFEVPYFDLGEAGYPIQPKEHGVGFLQEQRHLWLRSSRQRLILAVRHSIIKAIRDYFDSRGFTLVDAPILTPAACEGTSTLFEVPYFDLGKAFLTQSGQLYGEAAAMAVGKAYVFGPTFRAEKSKTRRHLTEFWMVEPEVAYMDLDGDMDLAE